MKRNQVDNIAIQKFSGGCFSQSSDLVAVEEPLEIRISYGNENGRLQKNIAVTMRTPGNDDELAAGFLFTENIIPAAAAIDEIKQGVADDNTVLVKLKDGIMPVLGKADRNFYASSSCGICGKASIEAIRMPEIEQVIVDDLRVGSGLLYDLQVKMHNKQQLFESTGGIHACALFSPDGEIKMLREDVGRHNALDKIIGAMFLQGIFPLDKYILLLSGRAGFEMIQKAVVAGIRIVAAVGAPSSLAVELAKETGITLIGFLKQHRFNVYSGEHRIIVE